MSAANRDASLNRATSIGGVNCTNDVLGNRLTKGSTSYSWDALNRMAALTNSSYQTSYVYRADGMRVAKTGFDGDETRFTRYRYDGQMGIEDYETRDNNQVNGVRSVLTQYGLGARGIDYMKTTTVPGTGQSTPPQTDVVDSYPIYDAHGNMVATLSKSGTNDYALSNQRSFDAWGNVRIGSASGNPTGRYCRSGAEIPRRSRMSAANRDANIGHKQDDESGLIYMRARYYEPTSGRFVSEDPSMDGSNWYSYCGNNPVDRADSSGRFWHLVAGYLLGAGIDAGIQYLLYGEIDWTRVAISGVAGACGAGVSKLFLGCKGVSGGWLSALLGKSPLELGKRLSAQVLGGATRCTVKGIGNSLNSQQDRELGGPLVKSLWLTTEIQ